MTTLYIHRICIPMCITYYYILYTLDILVTDKTIEIKNLGPWLFVSVVIVFCIIP